MLRRFAALRISREFQLMKVTIAIGVLVLLGFGLFISALVLVRRFDSLVQADSTQIINYQDTVGQNAPTHNFDSF